MEFLFFWLICMVFIGWWADQSGRSVLGFMALAFVASPLIAGLVLAVKGKKAKVRHRRVAQTDAAKRLAARHH